MSFFASGLVLSGTARDLVTLPSGRAQLAGEAAVRARTRGPRRELVELQVRPERPGLQERLAGQRVGSGFRARVRAEVPGEEGSPLGLLLDDLPGAGLISGYVHMRADAHAGRPPGASAPPDALGRMSDICSGWRAGGTAMSSVARGQGVPVQDCPPAPDLDDDPGDPLAWQPMEPLARGAMRRRRRLDVWGRDTAKVDAMFRDTYGEPDGTEVVLHEYGLEAIMEGPELVLVEIEATPRVLPFWECPLAAESVGDLLGLRAAELRQAVPLLLAGTRGCTHLNDLLRVLADVGHLATMVPEG
jgi:hypothetical protein